MTTTARVAPRSPIQRWAARMSRRSHAPTAGIATDCNQPDPAGAVRRRQGNHPDRLDRAAGRGGDQHGIGQFARRAAPHPGRVQVLEYAGRDRGSTRKREEFARGQGQVQQRFRGLATGMLKDPEEAVSPLLRINPEHRTKIGQAVRRLAIRQQAGILLEQVRGGRPLGAGRPVDQPDPLAPRGCECRGETGLVEVGVHDPGHAKSEMCGIPVQELQVRTHSNPLRTSAVIRARRKESSKDRTGAGENNLHT